jgi:hypothetical protein
MEIAAILLTLGVIVLVGFYLYAPFLDRRSERAASEEHELSSLLAERDRVITSLQELDFDYKLGKIPEWDYPAQRTMLLQKGADVLKQIDTLTIGSNGRGGIEKQDEEQDTEQRIENAIAARRTNKKASQPHKEVSDDEIESMIVTRRKARKEKSAGFCPKCGKPVMASDRFCPSCGKAL